MRILREEIKVVEDKLNEFREWTIKELKKIHDEMKEWKEETQAHNYLRELYAKLREEEFLAAVVKIENELIGMK